MKARSEQESLWTAEQVAQRLQVKVGTVYQAATLGRIPCVKLWAGRRRTLIRFRPEDIEQLIQQRTVVASE